MEIRAVLEKFLLDNPGPVSIAAGIAALREGGIKGSTVDLQALIGTFAAERGRPIRFDRKID
ncbi:hypothetical protein [Mesorhizobium amorphae]|uniref:hypothetical protein n=1 Tax=Mesorhizobium amorphae TaxID=71433 RepID=UPI0017869FDF|nr:hypothetical protein [Mesorhizobium amorphae]